MPAKSKTWFLAGLTLTGLLAIAAILLIDQGNTLKRDKRSIVLENPGKVNRIVLKNQYDSTFLFKSGSSWYLPTAEPAGRTAVENVLFAAGHLSLRSVLSAESISSEWERVSVLFMRDERELLKYNLYFNDGRHILHLPGSDNFYLVSIPGYETIPLEKVFSPVTNHYHEKHLVGLLPGEISLLEVYIPAGSHFMIRQDSTGTYECHDLEAGRRIPADSVNDHTIRLLLSYFAGIRYEKVYDEMNAAALRADLGDRMMAKLVVMPFQGEQYTLEVYPLPAGPEGDPDMFRALVIYNDRPDVLIVNYIYLDVLMRGLEHYVRQAVGSGQ